ncbi:MAG: transposase [Planctomycetes bacterium]|nr:transposase [Planctomycetota bacterium]
MPDRPNRQSHRLQGYDYTEPRSYFVTICSKDRSCIFGEVVKAKTVLNPLGVLAERELLLLPRRRKPWVALGEYVIMPNHIHAIIINQRGDLQVHKASRGDVHVAREPDGEPAGGVNPAPTLEPLSLGAIVGSFKAGVTREARRLGLWREGDLWQREYYDHVIRNESARSRINEYIRNNALRWHLDRENPNQEGNDDFDTWLTEQGKAAL